jgi:hypothetical protein
MERQRITVRTRPLTTRGLESGPRCLILSDRAVNT